MNNFLTAETAIYSVLNVTAITNLVKCLHLNVKSLKEYHDMLPAIGIKAVELTADDEGQEIVSGFCEVVAQGEYQTANRKSEEIGSEVYDILIKRNWKNVTFAAPVNDIWTTGMREAAVEDNGTWACVVQVFWKVML